MNFLKTSFYSAIGTGISLITRLITNKIVAVYLGTQGMFLIGQLKDFLKLTSVFSHAGTTNGTIKYTSEYKDNAKEFKNYLGTGFKVHFYFSLAVLLFVFLFKSWISKELFETTAYSTFLTVLAFSIVSVSIHAFFMSVLNGLKKIKLYILINIIATIVSALVLIYLVINYKILGAFYAFAVSQFLALLTSLSLLLIYKPFHLKLLWSAFNKKAFKNLTKFSIMALIGPLFLIAATLFVRRFLVTEFDENHSGSWVGMWRISAMYLLFLTTTFKFYLLPTFSTLSGNVLKKEVFKIWKFMLPIITIIALLVYTFKALIINVLLDEKFILVGTLIGFQLLGDTIRINGWVLGNILIAKAKTKAFILFQIEWAFVFSLLTYVFVNYYGFIGVSIAYFASYVIHFILMNIYFKDLLWKSK